MAGLAIVRSLGRAGLEVHLVQFESTPVTRSSRYVRQHYDLGHPLRQRADFCSQVLELVEQTQFDLVIPVSDTSLVPLMPFREQLARRTKFAAPTDAGFAATNNKAATWRLALRCDVPVPPSVLVQQDADIQSALALDAYPLVLKPIQSVTAERAKRNAVRLADSADAAQQWLPEMLAHGPVLVQGFFAGRGVGVSVLGDHGKLVAAFQHRRVHEPPRGGASSYRQSVPLDPALLDGVRRMCEAMEWTGAAMFEFKQNEQSGQAVLIEINGRFWGSLPLAIYAGVDFPVLLYDLLVRGNAVETFDYRVPVFARYLPQEPYWLLANARAPAGRADVIKRDLRSTLGELSNLLTFRETWDIESFTDPLPALRSWGGIVAELAGDLRDKLKTRRHRRKLQAIGQAIRKDEAAFVRQLSNVEQILVLCHGNINRSAIASQRLRDLFRQMRSAPRVMSAGFVRDEDRLSSPLSQQISRELGVDLTGHRSTAVTEDLVRSSDLVVVMDARNAVDLAQLSPISSAQKLIPLGALDDRSSVEIEDPYGQAATAFRGTYERILRCADRLATLWQSSRC